MNTLTEYKIEFGPFFFAMIIVVIFIDNILNSIIEIINSPKLSWVFLTFLFSIVIPFIYSIGYLYFVRNP